MNQDFIEQDALKYFFGELSETELTAFEEKFFTDAEFSDRLEEFETDLIDDYLSGELSATEKMKFEEKYLVSPRRQERVKAAAAILEKEKIKSVAVTTPKLSWWESLKLNFAAPQLALVFPVILLLVLFGFIFFLTRQTPPDIAEKGNKNINVPTPTPSISPQPSPDNSPAPSISPTSEKTPVTTPIVKPSPTETPKQIEPPQPTLATFTLFPALRSDSEAKKITLKKETKILYLRLNRDLDRDFDKYLVEVRDSGGNSILTQNLSAKKTLGISIPTKSLSNGSYKITLKGAKADQDFKTVSFYNFLVEKK